MLKKLFSESVIYGGTTILVRLINYLLVPLHTGILSAESYGIVSILYAYAIILNVIYTYGMETAFFRFASKENEESKKTIFNNAQTIIIITSIVFSGGIILFADPISVFLGYPGSKIYTIWFAIILGSDSITSIAFVWLRQNHKAKKFSIIKIANVLIVISLNLFFFLLCPFILKQDASFFKPFIEKIYDPDMGLGYAFLANTIASILTIPMLWSVYAQWKPKVDYKKIKEMLRYGMPLLIAGLAFSINEVADRHFLKIWLPGGFYENINTEQAIGIYSGCYKLTIIISIIIQGYRYAADPFFFSKQKQVESSKLLEKSIHYFILICGFTYILTIANLDWLSLFLRREIYKTGLSIVPILLIANIFLGIYFNLSFSYKLTDKTYLGAVISTLGAIITIAANYILIPLYGFIGSAISTLGCYFFMALTSYLVSRKLLSFKINLNKSLLYLLVMVFIGYGMFQYASHSIEALIVKNTIALLIISITFFIERKSLKEVF